MKRIITLFLCLVMLFSVALADLSDREKEYAGSWVMYMANNEKTYLYTISFFENNDVTLKTLMFDGSSLSSDHTSTGQWVGFTESTVMISFGKNTFVGSINDEGLFVLLDYKTKEATAFFTRCPDLSDRMV